MGRKRPTPQRSKGRGSYGMKAHRKKRLHCVGCHVLQALERLNGDRVCVRCLNGTSKPPVYE